MSRIAPRTRRGASRLAARDQARSRRGRSPEASARSHPGRKSDIWKSGHRQGRRDEEACDDDLALGAVVRMNKIYRYRRGHRCVRRQPQKRFAGASQTKGFPGSPTSQRHVPNSAASSTRRTCPRCGIGDNQHASGWDAPRRNGSNACFPVDFKARAGAPLLVPRYLRWQTQAKERTRLLKGAIVLLATCWIVPRTWNPKAMAQRTG